MNTIKGSNSLDPNQARRFANTLFAKDNSRRQKAPLAGKELKREEALCLA